MAVVNDTTSTVINGKDGTADLQITLDGTTTATSYKCILDMFSVREVTEMLTSDVFCNEGEADQEPGRSQLIIDISGLGKKNGPASGPLIPAPQNCALLLQYSTGCTIATTVNFTEATATRMVNQNMRISGRALSKGAYVVTWDIAP